MDAGCSGVPNSYVPAIKYVFPLNRIGSSPDTTILFVILC
jgi:hypothetical protein